MQIQKELKNQALRVLASAILLWPVSGFMSTVHSNSPDNNVSTKVVGDFHFTQYKGAYGQVTGFEAFTKQPDKEVFFGLSCSERSPFPTFQVLLFNDDVLSETPKFMSVTYALEGSPNTVIPLQAILKPTDTADEFSNKLRIELDSARYKKMRDMEQSYQQLLSEFMAAQSVTLTFSHSRLGDSQYNFSLDGFKALVEPNQAVCR